MNGVLGFDEALRLSPARRLAMVVAAAELKHRQDFNWQTFSFGGQV